MAAEPDPSPEPPIFQMVAPVPQMGLPTDKFTLDTQFGTIALQVRKVLTDIVSSKGRLDGLTNDDLLDRGYNDTQIAQLRSAWNDLNRLANIFYGREAGGDAYDFSTFVKFLWGFGV